MRLEAGNEDLMELLGAINLASWTHWSRGQWKFIRDWVPTEEEAMNHLIGPELLETREPHREPCSQRLPSGRAWVGKLPCQGPTLGSFM